MMGAAMPLYDAAQLELDERTVVTRAVTWHVQRAGTGPVLLLLHGTGSSTHSWHGLLPRLAQRFTVIAVDLPGHGASVVHDEHALSLLGMAQSLSDLLNEIGGAPELIVGHSAGAALGVRLSLEGLTDAHTIISINGAFVPFGGPLGQFFSPVAKLMASSSMLSQVIARRAHSPDAVERLLRSTGSVIDDHYVDGYQQLFRSKRHVAATLGMMAKWDLWSLQRDLPQLKVTLHLLAARRDQTVPPEQAQDVANRVSDAHVVFLGKLGHLAHEEAPDVLAQQIFDCADGVGH